MSTIKEIRCSVLFFVNVIAVASSTLLTLRFGLENDTISRSTQTNLLLQDVVKSQSTDHVSVIAEGLEGGRTLSLFENSSVVIASGGRGQPSWRRLRGAPLPRSRVVLVLLSEREEPPLRARLARLLPAARDTALWAADALFVVVHDTRTDADDAQVERALARWGAFRAVGVNGPSVHLYTPSRRPSRQPFAIAPYTHIGEPDVSHHAVVFATITRSAEEEARCLNGSYDWSEELSDFISHAIANASGLRPLCYTKRQTPGWDQEADGSIGGLARGFPSGRIDVLVLPDSLNLDWYAVCTPFYPFGFTSYVFYIRRAPPLSFLEGISRIFDIESWLVLSFTLLALSFAYTTINRQGPVTAILETFRTFLTGAFRDLGGTATQVKSRSTVNQQIFHSFFPLGCNTNAHITNVQDEVGVSLARLPTATFKTEGSTTLQGSQNCVSSDSDASEDMATPHSVVNTSACFTRSLKKMWRSIGCKGSIGRSITKLSQHALSRYIGLLTSAYGLIIVSAFTGSLTGNLSAPGHSAEIDTLQALIENTDIIYARQREISALKDISNDRVIKDLLKKIVPLDARGWRPVISDVARGRARAMLFLDSWKKIALENADATQDGYPLLREVSEKPFPPSFLTSAMAKYSPYGQRFYNTMMMIVDTGLDVPFGKLSFPKFSQRFDLVPVLKGSPVLRPYALALEHLKGAFLIWGLCLLVATLIFLAELCWVSLIPVPVTIPK